MFSLIITIIAIALVAALALASIYYGGSAFNKGSEKAAASTLINNAMQVSAAMTLAEVEGVTPAAGAVDGSHNLVTGNYLSGAVNGLSIGTTGNVVGTPSSQAVCDAVNAQSDHTDTAAAANAAAAEAVLAAMTDAQFGCETADDDTLTFVFKH